MQTVTHLDYFLFEASVEKYPVYTGPHAVSDGRAEQQEPFGGPCRRQESTLDLYNQRHDQQDKHDRHVDILPQLRKENKLYRLLYLYSIFIFHSFW